MRIITVDDLKDQTRSTVYPQPILHCDFCGTEASADKSDYFSHSSTHAFVCCGEPMELVIKRTEYHPIELPQ